MKTRAAVLFLALCLAGNAQLVFTGNVKMFGALKLSHGHGALLSWTASATAGVTSYNVYRVTSSSGTSPATPYPSLASGIVKCTALVSPGTCKYSDNAVVSGASYWYYATAVGPGGESAPSNTARAVIP